MENKVFIGFLAASTVAFFWLLMPFFGAIFWACAIAIIFYPLKKKLLLPLGERNTLAALLALVACCVIVIIPGFVIATAAVNEGQEWIEKVKNDELNAAQYVDKVRSSIPAIERALGNIGLDLETIKAEVREAIKVVGGMLTKNSLLIGKSAVSFFLNVGIMLYITFFLLRDGKEITQLIFRAIPLGDQREKKLFDKFTEITRATVKGNLIVAGIQGLIGGVTFWFLGIDGVVLWAFLMAVAAMIPAIGSAIIWGPVALYFLLSGNLTDGIIMLVVGIGVIGMIDNILRPILVGRDTKMPDYIVLVSTLSGLALFGINGFIIGPLIAALFFVSWSIFIDEFQSS